MTASYKRIAAVRLAFEILEHLSERDEPATGTEIAASMRLPYGTVMSHLATLSDGGYVALAGERYKVGPKMAAFWAKSRAALEVQRTLIDRALSALGNG